MIDTNNNQISPKKKFDLKLTFSLKALLLITALIFAFVSIDYYVLTPFGKSLNDKFVSGIGNPHFFSLFDVMIMLICINLIYEYGLSFKAMTLPTILVFTFALTCFVLKLANPNNNSSNPILGLPLFSEVRNYTYVIFLTTLLFLRKDILLIFLRKVFVFFVYVIVIRSIILLVLFAAKGGHSFFFGIKSVLIEEDSLLIFGFFQSILLALYFIRPKEKKYIIGWGILLLIQIFSSRRSPLFISLIVNAFIFLLYYIREMNISKKLIILMIVLLAIFILPTLISNISPAAKVYIDRYLGVITNNSTNEANTDSGHFDQSKMTTQAALKLGFWGVGYGNRLILEGAFQINGEYFIHNVFAAFWAYYGVYEVVYYLFLILMVIIFLFGALIETNPRYFPHVLLKYSVAVYFLCYMWGMYYTTMNFVIESKMSVFLIMLLIFIIRFSPQDLSLIEPFGKLKE